MTTQWGGALATELGSEAVLNDCENRREKLLFTLDPILFTHSSAEGVGLFMTTINISYRLMCGHSLSFLLYLRGELPGHKVTVHLNSWTRVRLLQGSRTISHSSWPRVTSPHSSLTYLLCYRQQPTGLKLYPILGLICR